jgi:hypothetical protein
MYHLNPDDVADLTASIKRFKIIVPLESIKSQCDGEILSQLFDNMLDLALHYTESICRFKRIVNKFGGSFDESGERAAIEEVRGSIHDSFIVSVNVLCRMMLKAGKSVEWRDRIGEDRAALGRFALTLSFEAIRSQNEKGGV